VLLKPTTDRQAQLIVMGGVQASGEDAAWFQRGKAALLPIVLDAFRALRRRFEVVVCEGAGGIAEINLRQGDLANLGLAEAAGLPVLVVCDIDRGGVFASAFGSLALLDPGDQARVKAFLINRFRGDPSLLGPGIAELERRTGRPVIGIVPWVDALAGGMDAEDSLALPNGQPRPRPGGDGLSVAAIRFPRISNFTDFDALTVEAGVEVRYVTSPAEVLAADLTVLPGTKATVADLAWLRQRRLGEALLARAAAGGPILGVCGGYQMLGERITDGVESRCGEALGLGLLPVTTIFEPEKVLARPSGFAPRFDGEAVSGYEIHHGRVTRTGGEAMFRMGGTDSGEEGCRAGAVLGTSWHGVLECDGFRRALLSWVASVRGRDWRPGAGPFARFREARLDAMGDLIETHVDTAALARLIEGAEPVPLPTVETRLIYTGEGHPSTGEGLSC
ncbi:MAG: cobyric acid synthase, partial [Actinomycetota bacterium]